MQRRNGQESVCVLTQTDIWATTKWPLSELANSPLTGLWDFVHFILIERNLIRLSIRDCGVDNKGLFLYPAHTKTMHLPWAT